MPEDEAKLAEFRMQRVLVDPQKPPKPVHKFSYSVAAGEIALEMGHYDVREVQVAVNAAKESGDTIEGTLYITDRFVLSPAAAFDMLRQAKNLVKFLKEKDLVPVSTLEAEAEIVERENASDD